MVRLDYPRSLPDGSGPRARRRLPVPAGAEDRHRIDGAAGTVTGHGQDRLHVRLERPLQGPQRAERVVAFLVVGQGLRGVDVAKGRVRRQRASRLATAPSRRG